MRERGLEECPLRSGSCSFVCIQVLQRDARTRGGGRGGDRLCFLRVFPTCVDGDRNGRFGLVLIRLALSSLHKVYITC